MILSIRRWVIYPSEDLSDSDVRSTVSRAKADGQLLYERRVLYSRVLCSHPLAIALERHVHTLAVGEPISQKRQARKHSHRRDEEAISPTFRKGSSFIAGSQGP